MLRPRAERGFALLAVTITLATLALILGAVAFAARNYVQESASAFDGVTLSAALDAGEATAGHDLSGPHAGSLQYLRLPQSFSLGDIAVTLSARPESGKVDINAADPAMLAALIEAAGLDKNRAKRLADEIVDWRGGGSAADRGADAAAYFNAGRHGGPAHTPMAAVGDLAQILDGSAELPRCLDDDVTVFARRARPDLAAASPRVRRALAMIDPEVAKRLAVVGTVPASGEADIYDVDIQARSLATGAQMSRRVIMRVTGDPHRPYWILSQSEPVPDAAEAARACTRLTGAA